MTDNLPDRLSVDREYARRWAWWDHLPESEKEQLAQAEREGDRKALYRLTRRGKRRERFKASQVCYHGELGCECMVRALDHSRLVAFLTERGMPASALSFVAQQFHRDSLFSVKKWIAARQRQQEEREEIPPVPAVPVPAPMVSATVEPLESPARSREEEALAEFRRRGNRRTPRYWDPPAEGAARYWDYRF